MDIIFKLLLNRQPKLTEYQKFKNNNINIIKKYIKETDEFRLLRNRNMAIINDIFKRILNINDNINNKSFIIHFINLGYNESKMEMFCLDFVNKIKEDYKLFYKKYLGIDEEIETQEIIEILKTNDLEKYICTSDKFLKKSEERLNRILCKN